MAFDEEEIRSILKIASKEALKKFVGQPLSPDQQEIIKKEVQKFVGNILDKFAELGQFKSNPDDITITFVGSQMRFVISGETAKLFCGEKHL